MTTIFRVSEQDKITGALAGMEATMAKTSGVVVQDMPEVLDEAALVDEMDKIERCAAAGTDYVYGMTWDKEHVSQLREYASVCGLKGKMVPGAKAVEASAPVIDDDPDMKRLAEIAELAQPKVSADLALAVGDPFHLTDKDDRPAARDNWQTVTAERKLSTVPSMSGGVMPLRGEYEYGVSPQLRVRRGENSISDPDAIGKLKKEEDTGERLRTEAKTTQVERENAKRMWEKEAIAKAKALGAGALPRGNTFMTAATPPKMSTSDVDLKTAIAEITSTTPHGVPSLPDLTDGEKLRQTNANRKAGIQRKSETDDWQKVKGSTRPVLQDEFAEALEFQMRKAGVITDQA